MVPALGRYLTPEEGTRAERCTLGTIADLDGGQWQPSLDGHAGLAAMVVVDGLLLRHVGVGRARSVELLGDGDAVLSLPRDQPAGFLEPRVSWTVVEPTRVMWLTRSFADAAHRWPGLWLALCERVEARAHRGAVARALAGLTRVDDRVHALLWVLSERWGRVTPEGVVVPLRLTHRVLAELVGSRRPTVTTAVGLLETRGLLARHSEGGWVLRGDAPDLDFPDAGDFLTGRG